MAKMGVGIVGTGWVAGEHIRAFKENPNTKIVALCALTERDGKDKAAEWRAKLDEFRAAEVE